MDTGAEAAVDVDIVERIKSQEMAGVYCYYIFTLLNISTCDDSDYRSTYRASVNHQ